MGNPERLIFRLPLFLPFPATKECGEDRGEKSPKSFWRIEPLNGTLKDRPNEERR